MTPFQVLSEASELFVPRRIERIPVPDPLVFYREYVSQSRPVIITGAATSWPCMRLWRDNEYLVEKLGTKNIDVAMTPDGRADAIANGMFVKPKISQMDASETLPDTLLTQVSTIPQGIPFCFVSDTTSHHIQLIVEKLLGMLASKHGDEGVPYLSQQNGTFLTNFQELHNDAKLSVGWMDDAMGAKPDAVNLWIGDRRSVTSTHKDPYENLYLVVCGKKTFTLNPPTDLPYMYYKTYEAGTYEQDHVTKLWSVVPDDHSDQVPWIPVNTGKPDYDQYPLQRHAKQVIAIVNEGEMLYLPSLWFHNVGHVDDKSGRTIALNYWYDMKFGPNWAYFEFLNSLTNEEIRRTG